MFNFIKELKKIEDKYGIMVCLHELIESGSIKLAFHPIIKKSEEEKILLPEAMKNEIKQLLAVEYCRSFLDKILIFFGLKAFIRFPVVTFAEGVTIEEIYQKQNNWSAIHNADNDSRN